jgi:hypothetical protein
MTTQEQTSLSPLEKDGKWGFIDSAGKEVIPFIYDDAFDFSREVLEIYRKLAVDNPENYQSDVAMALNNLEKLHKRKIK